MAKKFVIYGTALAGIANWPLVRGTIFSVPPPITICNGRLIDCVVLSLVRVPVRAMPREEKGAAAVAVLTVSVALPPGEIVAGENVALTFLCCDPEITALKFTMSFGEPALTETCSDCEQPTQSDKLETFALIANVGSVTVSDAGTVCARAPLVPLKVIVTLPAVADVDAEKVTPWLVPALTEKGEAGEEETPWGSP